MASHPKMLVPLSILLTIILCSNKYVNGIQSISILIPDKTIVKIVNKLNTQLGVHCKDKKHDLGPQTLQTDQEWSFKFRPNPFWDATLYFCSFQWGQTIKHFDIYKQTRDKNLCTECSWNIAEPGPCRFTNDYTDCYKWKDDSIVAEEKQIVMANLHDLGV